MTWRERFKAIVFSLIFVFGGYLLAILLLLPLPRVFPGLRPGFLGAAAIQSAALLLAYGFLTWLIGGKLFRFSRADFERPGPPPGVWRRWSGFGWGMGLGVMLGAVAMAIAVPLGQAAWRGDGGTPIQWLAALALTGGVLLPAALAEELAFRGVPLLALDKAIGRVPALLGLAVLFSLAHLDNPNVSGLAVGNIGLAGVFLGLVFFTAGGIWTSTGAHLGWNLSLAGLAAPVSGVPVPMPWVDYSPGGPRWLTGGSFGPEGGALATLCLLSGAWIALRRMRPTGGKTT